MENYTAKGERWEEFEKNLKVGDQMAFIILIDEEPNWLGEPGKELPEGMNPDYPKILKNFCDIYYPNNKLFYEAMKENKELPELKITPWVFILNKTDK